MHFSEKELREALRRKDPGEGFTQKVMERIAQPQAHAEKSSSEGNWLEGFWRGLRVRAVLVGVSVAVLAISGSLGVLRHRKVQEARAGEAAKRQVLLALRITGSKLHHVFERAKNAQVPVMEEGKP